MYGGCAFVLVSSQLNPFSTVTYLTYSVVTYSNSITTVTHANICDSIEGVKIRDSTEGVNY